MNIKIIKNIIIRTERRIFKKGTLEMKIRMKMKANITPKATYDRTKKIIVI